MKSVLILSSSPLKHDGLTKLIFEIIDYNYDYFSFELATPESSNYDEIKNNVSIKKYVLPKKKNLLKYLYSINKIVRENNYDVVYIHGNSALMFFETIASKLFCKSKIVTHCHSSASDYKFVHNVMKPIFNMIPDMKIGCSKISSEFAYTGKNVVTIQNGIEINKFKFNAKSRKEIRRQLGINEDVLLIGNIGRLAKVKNQLFLIEIVEQYFLNYSHNCKLVIIGNGELKQELINKACRLNLKEKTIILEPIDDIEKYYNAIDVMVMPSLFEGMSLVALEAQANCLPCIVSEGVAKSSVLSDYVKVESLKSSPRIWADDIACSYNSLNRMNTDLDYNFRRQIDINVTMNKIREILEKV